MKKIVWFLLTSAVLCGYLSTVSCNKKDDNQSSPIVGEWMATQFKGSSTNYTTTPPTTTPLDEQYTSKEAIYLKFNGNNTYSTRISDTASYNTGGTYALLNNNSKLVFSISVSSDTVDIMLNGNTFSMSTFKELTTDKFDSNGQKIGTSVIKRDEGILTMKKL